MALGLNFGNGAVAGDGESLLSAFTKINNMFSTTSKLIGGDLSINGVNIGSANYYNSTRLGESALNVNAGNDNTAVGWSSLSSHTSGGFNTALGSGAMRLSNGAIRNTAVGGSALQSSTAQNNSAFGFEAARSNTSGTNNTAIGGGALFSNQIRNNNTAIGDGALYFNTQYSGATGLGYDSNVDGDNQIQLGNTLATPYAYNALNVRSDERDKADIRDTVLGLDFINELRPVDYKFDYREDYRTTIPTPLELDATEEEKDAHKIIMDEWIESCKIDNLTHDGTHIRSRFHHGLIAQEVKEVIEASGVDFGGFQDHKVNGGGDVLSLGYSELIAPMIKAIQELTARINVLEGN